MALNRTYVFDKEDFVLDFSQVSAQEFFEFNKATVRDNSEVVFDFFTRVITQAPDALGDPAEPETWSDSMNFPAFVGLLRHVTTEAMRLFSGQGE